MRNPRDPTWERLWEEFRRAGGSQRTDQPVHQLLQKYPRLVVLGPPGAGKTTLLRFIALALAEGPEVAKRRLGEASEYLPLLVPLAGYATALVQDETLALMDFLPEHLRDQSLDIEGLPDLLQRELTSGHVRVLLDGLDEVTNAAQRNTVVRRVEQFLAECSDDCKVAITSRLEGYTQAALGATVFHHVSLSLFTPWDAHDFAQRWCTAYERFLDPSLDGVAARRVGETEARRLMDTIADTPGVRRLVSNPLLLSMIAIIHRQERRLPHHRAELYDRCIQTLVETWAEARSLAAIRVGQPQPYAEAIKILAPLVLWMHTKPGRAVKRGDFHNKIVEILLARRISQDEAEAATRQFLDLLKLEVGLLMEVGQDAYGFVHPTFEECLAARALVMEGQRRFERTIQRVLEVRRVPAWHEVILLTAGYVAVVEPQEENASDLVSSLLAGQLVILEEDLGQPTVLPDDRTSEERAGDAILAGECLADVGRQGVQPDVWDAVLDGLYQTMTDSQVLVSSRRDAGLLLGELNWLPSDLDALLPVPGANILIVKYPVVNAQYRRFIEEAQGYDNPEYWTEDGWRWRTAEPLWRWQRTDCPDRWDEPRFSNPLQPVVGVTWYEARAYCNWLTRVWQAEGRIAADEVVRLPTDGEWRPAAWGDTEWEYPWGNGWDANKANTAESGLGAPNPVGMYPNGASVCGVLEMVGNVWEWTETQEVGGRILLGGCWGLNRLDARRGAWSKSPPFNSVEYSGFRIVVAHVPSGPLQ